MGRPVRERARRKAAVRIRIEAPEDADAVRAVNEAAFEGGVEADIVESLRDACPDCLSLVAEDEGGVVGHILFSPVVVETGIARVVGMGLGPMAVVPEKQRAGIGSALVEEGLSRLRDGGYPFAIVLGHPDFYPRFGFEPASNRNLASQWPGVPDEAFMVCVLDEAAMKGVVGIARYRDEFDDAV